MNPTENPYKAPAEQGTQAPLKREAMTMREVIAGTSGIAFVASGPVFLYCSYKGLIGPDADIHWKTLTWLAGIPMVFVVFGRLPRLRWFRWVWVATCVFLLGVSIFHLLSN